MKTKFDEICYNTISAIFADVSRDCADMGCDITAEKLAESAIDLIEHYGESSSETMDEWRELSFQQKNSILVNVASETI